MVGAQARTQASQGPTTSRLATQGHGQLVSYTKLFRKKGVLRQSRPVKGDQAAKILKRAYAASLSFGTRSKPFARGRRSLV